VTGGAADHPIGRRRFLALAAAAGFGAAVGCSGTGEGGADPGEEAAERDDALLAACAVLAAAVSTSAPDLTPLDDSVLARDDADGVRAAAAALRDAIAADFVAGATVDAGGWVLATTEARLVLAVAA
jgi:hypothetical protein